MGLVLPVPIVFPLVVEPDEIHVAVVVDVEEKAHPAVILEVLLGYSLQVNDAFFAVDLDLESSGLYGKLAAVLGNAHVVKKRERVPAQLVVVEIKRSVDHVSVRLYLQF